MEKCFFLKKTKFIVETQHFLSFSPLSMHEFTFEFFTHLGVAERGLKRPKISVSDISYLVLTESRFF